MACIDVGNTAWHALIVELHDRMKPLKEQLTQLVNYFSTGNNKLKENYIISK